MCLLKNLPLVVEVVRIAGPNCVVRWARCQCLCRFDPILFPMVHVPAVVVLVLVNRRLAMLLNRLCRCEAGHSERRLCSIASFVRTDTLYLVNCVIVPPSPKSSSTCDGKRGPPRISS